MRTLLSTICCLTLAASALATTWTVSNVSNRPAQFTNLADAQSAAVDGDTVLVYGGGGDYPNFYLSKSLHIVGEGMGPSVPSPSISYFYFDYVSVNDNPDGASLEGFDIYRLHFNGNEDYQDITVKRCRINYVEIYPSNHMFHNVDFINNWIHGNIYIYSPYLNDIQDLVFTNCVFSEFKLDRSGGTGDANSQIIFRNNLFINQSSATFNNEWSELVVENCIFYDAEPTGATESVFNHNLSYYCTSNDLPPGDNAGANNIVNAAPGFVNGPPSGASFSWDYDFSLVAGAAAAGAGVSGTDIGLTGGDYPIGTSLPEYPATPAVVNVNLPTTSVPVGGTLQISIEATSRD